MIYWKLMEVKLELLFVPPNEHDKEMHLLDQLIYQVIFSFLSIFIISRRRFQKEVVKISK